MRKTNQQRAIDLFHVAKATLTKEDVWLAKKGHMGQAESLIRNGKLHKFGADVVTHGIGAGYDYTITPRGKAQREVHRKLFEKHCSLSKENLYCHNDYGLHGDVVDEETIIPTLAYRFGHYAQQIIDLPCLKRVILEIGGGWGLLGHILHNCQEQQLCYVAVDLPSCLMLAAYFLMDNEYTVSCYGEYDDLADAIEHSDVVCIPPCEVKNIPDLSVDVVFNANSFPEMPEPVIREYMRQIRRTCQHYFYYDNLVNSDFPKEVGGAKRLQQACNDILMTHFQLVRASTAPIHTDRPWIGSKRQELRDYQEHVYNRM